MSQLYEKFHAIVPLQVRQDLKAKITFPKLLQFLLMN